MTGLKTLVHNHGHSGVEIHRYAQRFGSVRQPNPPLLQRGESEDLKVHHEKSLFKRIEGVWYYVEAM